MTTYRWLEQSEIELWVNPECARRGYAQLNINEATPTCRVYGAFWDDDLIEVFVFQLFPMLGPLIRMDHTFRDDGRTTRGLVEGMVDFLVNESAARAVMTVADSPFTERLCERFEMNRIEKPVYEYIRKP